MRTLRDLVASNLNSMSYSEGIDEGRRALADGDFAELLYPEREAEAVRALRDRVPQLSPVDAVKLVRRARGDGTRQA